MNLFTFISEKFRLVMACKFHLLCCILLFPLVSLGQMFYGMTSAGGTNNGEGTLFIFNPVNNNESILWNFGSGNDGYSPYGAPVYDTSRRLFYAMTDSGGTNDEGTVITYGLKNNSENVVWSFGDSTDGVIPYGELVYNASKKLYYGLTLDGGDSGWGTIISFDPVKDSDYLLWSFGSFTDGRNPLGDMIYDSKNGLYYGTTSAGGTKDSGVIFSFNPSTNKEKVEWNFTNVGDGKTPNGSLVYDSMQKVYYGTAENGGTSNYGVIFSFNPASKIIENVVYNFTGPLLNSDGAYPMGNLALDTAQELYYGMTNEGGLASGGVIFSFKPSSGIEKVVWNFNLYANDGLNPNYQTPVWNAVNHLFYGMTTYGGVNGTGTLFSFDPIKDTEIVVWNFGNGSDGALPYGNLTFMDTNQIVVGKKELTMNNGQWTIYPNPSNGKYTIQSTAISCQSSEKPILIEIYTIFGQRVYSEYTLSNSQFIIDISGQPAGIYFVRLFLADGETFSKEVVKE